MSEASANDPANDPEDEPEYEPTPVISIRAERPERAPLRRDLQLIADMITPGARVLDVGCGDGALLDHLVYQKQVDGRGIELSQNGVNAVVSHGLSVIQGDADTDLIQYPDGAFDFVVLSQTLQATRNPRDVLLELVRIGQRAIVSFTNFGHWRLRWRFLLDGCVPIVAGNGQDAGIVTGNGDPHMAEYWYDTPNIHLCTIRDFSALCTELGLEVEQAVSLSRTGKVWEINRMGTVANLRGQLGIFLLARK